MTDDEIAARKARIAKKECCKDAADYIFRVVQVWVVLALIVYFQRQTGSSIATVTMLVLTLALVVYSYTIPFLLMEKLEVALGRELPGVAYFGVLIGTVMVMFPLLFSDPIIDEINRITHPMAVSAVAHP